MKIFITGGRCSGKTALMKQKFKSGYAVFSDDNYARLCYSDYGPPFTIIDDAYKDINPTKYEHLVKLGKHLKLGKQIKKQTKKREMQYLKRIKIKKNK
jgi:dephospho-CoA kinase